MPHHDSVVVIERNDLPFQGARYDNTFDFAWTPNWSLFHSIESPIVQLVDVLWHYSDGACALILEPFQALIKAPFTCGSSTTRLSC